MSSNNTQFQALLSEFCASVDLAMEATALGIEFEADGHTVLIVPDPRSEERLLIEVDVIMLEAPAARLLELLHNLNHEARLEHDWVATLDVTNRLHLHSQQALSSCTAGQLQSLLAEGIDRAQALKTVCESLGPLQAEPTESSLVPPMNMIRA